MDMALDYGYSPAPSSAVTDCFDDMTDEELDKYFANFVPLSNLPTPPPTKDLLSASTRVPSSQAQPQSPELEAYATHLSNLVPNNVSSRRPCTAIIQNFLESANLPDEIIAFAGCLIDTLSRRFAGEWRDACLLPNLSSNDYFLIRERPYIGSEVIVLAALAIAHGFLSDRERSTRHWAEGTGGGLFTVRDVEVAKWCLLQDIDYGLVRISEGMVKSMLKEMQSTAVFLPSQPVSAKPHTTRPEKEKKNLTLVLDYQGAAVWENGMQTPEPSP